jgi:hypothetical protein
MIDYTLSLSNIPFFNIIPNGTKHIHKKNKVMLYKAFTIPKGVKGAFIVKGTKDCVYMHKILHPLDFEK